MNEAIICSTPEDLIVAMFGPRQHDAHVESRQRHNWLTDREAQSALASLAVMSLVDEINAQYRAAKAMGAHQIAAE